MRASLTLCLATLFYLHGFPQYFSTGQDPASIRWRQIKTQQFRLIYPEPFGQKAQYLANILEITCRNSTTTLAAKVPRIPVILHTHDVISNGVTVWAPRRIELYPCPPQQSYAEEWLEQLVIHEYRHAVQISKMNQGFTRALYYLFGEQITGGILGLYLPAWFLEGDATVSETALTRTGRGRSALFESTLRAQLMEKGPYSYDKATLGSYRTFVPDAYALGYYLTGQARKKYGTALWNKALDKVAKYPFMVVPFNSGIRKETGLWKTGLYRQSLRELDSLWQKQLQAIRVHDARQITRRDSRNFRSYDHPQMVNDSTLFTVRSGIDEVDRFILVNRLTGDEKNLLIPGYYFQGEISAGGGYLAWSEQRPDPRWANQGFAEILLYDLKTGRKQNLTHRTRYFSPAISPDGSRVAVVNVTLANECSVDLLAIPDGNVLRNYKIPDYQMVKTPSWVGNSGKILFTLLTPEGETIAILDTASGSLRSLLPPSDFELSRPQFFNGHYITYSADYSGVRNIYAYDTLSNLTFQVSSGKFASYDPDFDSANRTMIFSDYTSDGLMIAAMPVEPAAWLPLSNITNRRYRLAEALASQEKANIQDSTGLRKIYKMHSFDQFDPGKDTIEGKIFPAKDYSKWLHLFNLHSWAPVSANVENLSFNPGVMVLSQNSLSTLVAGAGWAYDLSEETGKFYTTLSYQGLYPVFSFRFDIGNRAAAGSYHGSAQTFRFTWLETNLQATVTIPWNFSRGKYSRSLTPLIGVEFTGVDHNSGTPDAFLSGWFTSLLYGIKASHYLRSSGKDVFPRFGQNFEVSYQHAPFSTGKYTIFSTSANLYFPGLFRHHGIRIYGGYQQRDDGGRYPYSFPNRVAYPRGYSGVYDDELVSIRTNYKFPLWYPDFSAGSVIYLKRLKLNLYYDWANGFNTGYINEYQSAGGELTADFHLLRFVAPIEMGVRSIYYPATGGWGAEFLYSVSF